MNEDLARERRRTTFDVKELSAFLYGGQKNFEEVKHLESLLLNDPAFDNSRDYFHSPEEAYENNVRKAVYFLEKRKELNLDKLSNANAIRYASEVVSQSSAFGLHNSMFKTMVMSQASDEQLAKWMPLINNYKIIGTYAQTEMGHGTFVRGLETTATYDPQTDSFILHSPTLTATKWWPGAHLPSNMISEQGKGLALVFKIEIPFSIKTTEFLFKVGHSTTHAVVLARLITQGKDHGVHSFMVQLRSLQDHTVLPGRKLGFIGPKMGYNMMDNGYVSFDNVRLPRENLLMKFVQVSPDGRYSKAKSRNEKVTYIAMVEMRAWIIASTAYVLSKACTIAIRYSAVRRQSKLNESDPKIPVDIVSAEANQRHHFCICSNISELVRETALSPYDSTCVSSERELQVLDYKYQQYALFPLLATAFAFWFTGSEMMKMYFQVQKEINQGNFRNTNELHATSSGLKAFTTQATAVGVEECRFRCGGHGFSLSSGFTQLYSSHAAPACTYEGENIVMFLQTARYLVKCCRSLGSGSPLSLAIPFYLSVNTENTRCPVTTLEDFKNPEVLVSAFRHRAKRLVKLAFNNLQTKISNGMSPENSWNAVSVDLVKAARAHCHVYVVETFAKNVEKLDFSVELRSVMNVIFNVYAIHGIVENAGDFLEDQYMNGEQMNLARDLLAELLDEMRLNAVGIVDSFGFSDHVLNSVLGRYDGNVYEHLMEWAEKCPSNQQEVLPAYEKYLRPLIKGKTLSKL